MEQITIELSEQEKERVLEFCKNANITIEQLFAVRVLEFITLKDDKEKK